MMRLWIVGSVVFFKFWKKPVTDRLMPIPATIRTSNNFVKIELKNLFIQLTFMLILIFDKHISGRPYRLDERRIFRIVAQFVTQTAHRDIHGAVECIAFYSSQLNENLV